MQDDLELWRMCKKKRRSLGLIDVTGARFNQDSEHSDLSPGSSSDGSSTSFEEENQIEFRPNEQEQSCNDDRPIDDPVKPNDESPTSTIQPEPERDERDVNNSPDDNHHTKWSVDEVDEADDDSPPPPGYANARKDSGISVGSIESFQSKHMKPKKHLIERCNQDIERQCLEQENRPIDLSTRHPMLEAFGALQIDSNPSSSISATHAADLPVMKPTFHYQSMQPFPIPIISNYDGSMVAAYHVHQPHQKSSFGNEIGHLRETGFCMDGDLARSQTNSPNRSQSSFSENSYDTDGNPNSSSRKQDEKRSKNRKAAAACRARKLEKLKKLEAEKQKSEQEVWQLQRDKHDLELRIAYLCQYLHLHAYFGCKQ